MNQWRASAIASSVRRGELSAVEVVRQALDRITAQDARLHAFLEVFAEGALMRARELEAARASGESLGPLAGVPLAVKDNICFAQGHTTCASRMLQNYRSPYTATALERLLRAGAIVIGKTNLDEFAMGSSCEHSAFGPTRNPRDTTRVPGGSSGGSAAAVAAEMVPLALGSDTGGSIRQPAAFCGIVGLKPTYGRVSRYGLVAYASSLDQIGPMAKTVEDCALCLSIMAGHDVHDATSTTRKNELFHENLDQQPKQISLGMPDFVHTTLRDAETKTRFAQIISQLKAAGIQIREIDMPHADHAIAAYYILAPAEASSNLARYDGVRYGFRAELPPNATLEDLYAQTRTQGLGPEVRRRIMLGTHVLRNGYHNRYYLAALKARRRIKQDFDNAFRAGCDAVLMPTTPGPAFRLGEKLHDAIAMYAEDLYTVGANLAGLPALSLPAGYVKHNETMLPIGLQLIGPAWNEHKLLQLAQHIEGLVALSHPPKPV